MVYGEQRGNTTMLATEMGEAPTLPPWIEEQLPPGVVRYTVPALGETIHVMERQGEGPTVVMLHGNPTWSFLYRKVIAELADTNYRMVAPDLMGLGLSSKPRDAAAHTLDRHIQVLGAALDALNLGTVVGVVQDWGGPIGLGVFADRPEQLAGLVVLNTVVGPPRKGFHSAFFHRFSRMPVISDLAFRWLSFPQAFLQSAQGEQGSISGEVSRAYRHPLKRLADNVAPLALARMVPDGFAHPSIPALTVAHEFAKAFRGPTAVVWGDSDPVLGRVLGRVQRTFPEAPVTRTRAGHFLQEEVPDRIALAIRDVVQRSEARLSVGC